MLHACMREVLIRISAGTQTILNEVLRGFPHTLQENYEATLRLNDDGYFQNGHAIAQAVSRWLPTAAARVQNRV
jgi:hypothetical protein